MRIAIMGVGSLGTILGAYMSKAGIIVDMIDANRVQVDELNNKGANVIGTVNFTTKVKAITPEQMSGIYDIVFFMVKQTFNDIALAQLKEHLNEKSVVCTLQNGLPEYAISKVIGKDRTIGGVVGWGASMIGAGVSELTTVKENCEFDIGEINGEITERVKACKELLETMCKTEITDNLLGIRWNKIIANSAMSGMSAVIGGSFGDVLDNKEILTRAKFLANECIDVCNASGVHMAVRHGYDHGNLLHFKTKEEMEVKDWLFKKIWTPHYNLKASMLQDLEKGKRCEIDYINGMVSEIGRQYNVATPVNDQVIGIIKKIEGGKLKCQFSNANLIKLPEIK